MEHRGVLNVGPRTDDNEIVIATDDDVEPDRRFVFEDDPSDDGRARRNVMVVAVELDAAVAQKVQHRLCSLVARAPYNSSFKR